MNEYWELIGGLIITAFLVVVPYYLAEREVREEEIMRKEFEKLLREEDERRGDGS